MYLATLTGTLTSQQRRPEMTRSEFSTAISDAVNALLKPPSIVAHFGVVVVV
jgi:hypothetical protein